ncbi:hypothetical protein QJS10_CPB20g00247 [Acorus calamus]|uniref:F-box associated beta-propeller type 1 domain-containing protein n=1 Tax=Acorus calamus TaxID=4465 RepID=A0AAV9CEC6_ACOCL|nr:hypothetical protein QJS10_CPB20g00247 [Acorus calamus]
MEGKKFSDNNPTFIEFLSSSKLRIQDSSEGLLLCTPHNYGKHEEYHLWDPINGLRLKLPKPKYQLIDRTFVIAKLICDPLSSSYRVVCLFSQLARLNLPTNMIHIETYFSDAKEWMVSHHHSASPIGLIFPSEHNYVSLKGASHWMDLSGNIVMYNPDKDNLRVLKSPILPLQPGGGCHLFSLGVSEDGCLRCSTTHHSRIRVWILEDENLNRWSLRYQISIKIPWELDTYFFPYELFMLEAKIILRACTGEMLCYHLKSEALEPIEFQDTRGSKLYSFVAPTWPLLAP